MGHSLSHAAVSGTKSNSTFATDEQELLAAGDITGLIALKHSIFGAATMKEGEDDDDDASGDEDDSDDDDSDDDDDDGEDDDESDAKLKKANDRITELSAENKRYRQKAAARRQRILELEALAKEKPKKKEKEDDSGKDDSDSNDEVRLLKQQLAERDTKLVSQTLRNEFLSSKEFTWNDPSDAFKLLDLSEVDIDEEGDIEGLDDAIKKLAEKKPYLVQKDTDADDSDDDEDEDKPSRSRRTGQPPRRKKKTTVDREKLLKKYPSLAQH